MWEVVSKYLDAIRFRDTLDYIAPPPNRNNGGRVLLFTRMNYSTSGTSLAGVVRIMQKEPVIARLHKVMRVRSASKVNRAEVRGSRAVRSSSRVRRELGTRIVNLVWTTLQLFRFNFRYFAPHRCCKRGFWQ